MSAPAKGSPPPKDNATRERGEGEYKSGDNAILHHPDKSIKMELHPLCEAFPKLDKKPFDELCEDIYANGLNNPIVTYNGQILDGRNRYDALLVMGMAGEAVFIEYTGSDPVAYVRSANLHRRHLAPGQMAAIVALTQDWANAQEHGGDRKSDQVFRRALDNDAQNKQITPGNHQPDTTKNRAAISGASVSTQRRADAVTKANPELAQRVAHGDVPLQKAVEQVAPQLASKSKKTSAPESTPQEPEYDPNEDALAAAHETVVALAEENQQLKDAIAVGNLPASEQSAGEIIKELRARVKTLEASESAIAAMRDSLLLENKGLKEQCEIHRRQIKKLEGK